jgi:hypothetical protein
MSIIASPEHVCGSPVLMRWVSQPQDFPEHCVLVVSIPERQDMTVVIYCPSGFDYILTQCI